MTTTKASGLIVFEAQLLSFFQPSRCAYALWGFLTEHVVWYYFVMTCFVFLLTNGDHPHGETAMLSSGSREFSDGFGRFAKTRSRLCGILLASSSETGAVVGCSDLKIIFYHFLSRCLSFHPVGKSFIKIAIGREPQGKSTYLFHQIISMYEPSVMFDVWCLLSGKKQS